MCIGIVDTDGHGHEMSFMLSEANKSAHTSDIFYGGLSLEIWLVVESAVI